MAPLRTSSPKRALALQPLNTRRPLPRPKTLPPRESSIEFFLALLNFSFLARVYAAAPRRLVGTGRCCVGLSADAQPSAQPDHLQAALAGVLRGFPAPAAG